MSTLRMRIGAILNHSPAKKNPLYQTARSHKELQYQWPKATQSSNKFKYCTMYICAHCAAEHVHWGAAKIHTVRRMAGDVQVLHMRLILAMRHTSAVINAT